MLEVTISPSWIKNKDLDWKSNNSDIVEVSKDGRITAKKAGTATIQVIWKDKNLSAEINITAIELSKDTRIEVQKYKKENNKISGIGQAVKTKDFLSNIIVSDNLQVKLNNIKKDQKYVGTNTKVIISEKSHNIVIDEYDCLIFADVDGDGEISAVDYTLIKNHIMEVKAIEDKNMKLVADVDGDGEISAIDYTLIKNDIMGIKPIPVK